MVKDPPNVGRSLGLPDDAFEQRRPNEGQITKREVRAVSLYSLGLRRDSVVWDIGAGTGSISVEAALIAHNGQVYAVERDNDSLPLLEANVAQLGSENIHIVFGEAPGALEPLPSPDSVFVGSIVVNLAVLERTHEAYALLKKLGVNAELTQVASARGKEMPDGAVRLESLNPVFIVSGRRGN